MSTNNTAPLKVILSGRCNAGYNMALDEALAHSALKGVSPPTLRLYMWEGPAVTLGRFQNPDDINLEYCASNNIGVVRRPTGGRAILHISDELTYSFSSRFEKPFDGNLYDCYNTLAGCFVRAFESLGLEVKKQGRNKTDKPSGAQCFSATSFAELALEGKKLIGSAQRRWPEGFLQQGSIPLSIDAEITEKVFGKGAATKAKGSTADLRARVHGLTPEILGDAVKHGFESVLNPQSSGALLQTTRVTKSEEEFASRLETEKYLSEDWNLRKKSSPDLSGLAEMP